MSSDGRPAENTDANSPLFQTLEFVHLFIGVQLAIVFDKVPSLLHGSQRLPMRDHPRKGILTDEFPSRIRV
jgi:hypothetical protein